MIKWFTVNSKVTGFVYYPLLEMGTGVFLMICAVSVPLLFVIYNGVKPEQWGELLFCIFFFLLFFIMGKSLTFQKLEVKLKNDEFCFYQNLREPPTEFVIKESAWQGFVTSEEEVGTETMFILLLKDENTEKEFYRSVNRNEIKKISEAIISLVKNTKEEM
ncbi:MAG: hypothetical protein Kow0029_28160 [Candidatus Rifleibacteriota bacterium]